MIIVDLVDQVNNYMVSIEGRRGTCQLFFSTFAERAANMVVIGNVRFSGSNTCSTLA
jgi:hypothetical protein